ncbi:FunK1 protein kinase [Astrocystis sublimbata]|nr:FunK1 protein kinase [Astrocystis sublimbata]
MENHPVVNHPPTPLTSATDDQDILDNIDGRMHGPMSGFIKKYFGNFQHVHQDAYLEIQAAGRVSGRGAVPSVAPSPDSFLQWFSNYVSRDLDGARGSWHVSDSDAVPGSESGDNGTRLLLTMPTPTLPASDIQTRWDHVQVIGQFYQRSCVCYQDGLLRLCRSAHQVFASQPTRYFLHGFYIRGSLVEFWVFDRSGLYCSDLFDTHKDSVQFLSIIHSYPRMTDQELGKSKIIGTDKGGNYIIPNSEVTPSLGKLYLESQPVASREALVGTGTTCYRARMPDSTQWSYIVKFKWRWARERSEDELLKLAKKKCVWGAVSLDHYEELESTADLRRSLRWGKHRKFARMHFGKSNGNEGQRQEVSCNTDGLVEYTEETKCFFQNRILACMVTSPVGRPLHTFQSLLELLQVFRDAIKCHRSLCCDASILHQDISPGNMIILDGQGEGNPQGILIDLDSAIELDEGVETEAGITGTRPFMAIGVLKSERHMYRHDLESFLYVFLWTIITNHAENPQETSKLRQWSSGNWDELAVRKSVDMDQDGFQTIMGEFPPEFHYIKPLAERLRQLIFPQRAGAIWTGTEETPEAVDRLYDGMIRTFEEAIASEA